MTAEQECIHLLDPATCTLCNGRAKREADAARAVVRIFGARYTGQCKACDGPIYPGRRIAELGDGSYVHEDCQ
jgi:alkyl hydroperoxide reductase subunit AhpF